ncbi:MAG: CBS domain-containing protein [Kaiparowitsia implicata GSE-PSE-MK54-09C]|jgi:CBS domain-containing protein|nr:CBS domain-containing protein [Kaiparowitsia implicata GSE-PSE-MK54-09C]
MTTTVADVMTHAPIVVTPDTPLSDVIRLLAEKRISGLPVVDDHQSLVGVISEGDLMWQESGVTPPAYIMLLDSVIYLENPNQHERELHKALGQTVGEVMTKAKRKGDLVTITPNRPLREAATLMHERGVHRVLVVNDATQLVGIVTRGDIIRHMAAMQS